MAVTYREFRGVVHKGSDENYFIDKLLFRRISIIGSYLMSKTGIGANTVTGLSLICSVVSLWFFIQPEWYWQVAACALVFGYHYLDHVDGELARFYYESEGRTNGIAGSFFDVLCHSYSVNIWLAAITFALYTTRPEAWVALLGIVAVAGTSSFPRLVGYKVVGLRIAKDPAVLDTPGGQEAMRVVYSRGRQVDAVQEGLFTRRGLKKLIKESVGYPGMIPLVIVCVLIDAAAGTTIFRFALLGLLALARVAAGFLTTRRLMRAYEQVA